MNSELNAMASNLNRMAELNHFIAFGSRLQRADSSESGSAGLQVDAKGMRSVLCPNGIGCPAFADAFSAMILRFGWCALADDYPTSLSMRLVLEVLRASKGQRHTGPLRRRDT